MALPQLILSLLMTAIIACHGSTPMDFLAASCSATQYPQLCLSTLAPHAAAIRSDPTCLARTALNLTVPAASASFVAITRIAASGADMKPLEIATVNDCKEMMRDAVDELKRSLEVMAQLGGQFLGDQIENMQTWVSAALTNESLCADGLRWSSARPTRDGLIEVLQMTSNALCFINALVAN